MTLKVMTVLGTRPEIIRLSRVIAALRDAEGIDHVLVHTGQNHDPNLSDVFFRDLDVAPPDHHLGIGGGSLGESIAGVFVGTERIVLDQQPDAMLVLGDTNSCLAAVMARRMGVPVFHMEAGNRCWDRSVPEETNRRIIDHTADVNLVYTEYARRNLLAEGIHPRFIHLTGSPMREVLDHARPHIDASTIHDTLGTQPGRYLLASFHREENVDREPVLTALLEAFTRLHDELGLPVIASTHPRTRKRLDALGASSSGAVRFHEPFGFHDYNRLQIDAHCVLSDSGTISEESAILGFAAVTIRRAMERPESIDQGTIVLSGTDADDIVRCVHQVAGHAPTTCAADYQVTDTSQRVLRVITGFTPLVRAWQGLPPGR